MVHALMVNATVSQIFQFFMHNFPLKLAFHYGSNLIISLKFRKFQVKPVGRVKIVVQLINKFINACPVARSMAHTIWKLQPVFVIAIGLDQIVHKVCNLPRTFKFETYPDDGGNERAHTTKKFGGEGRERKRR